MIQYSLLALASMVVTLAIYVFRARPANSINRTFAIHTLTIGGWVLGIAGLQSGANLDVWSRITFFSASFMPPAFLAFMRTYPVQGSWPPLSLVRIALASGTVFAVLSLFTSLVVHSVSLTSEGPSRTPGPLYTVFALYMLAVLVPALAIFGMKWRSARGQARAQLQYLGTGLLVLGLGGISVNLVMPLVSGHSTHSWLGPFFILPMVVLVGHAIIRHRLMDLRIVINRGLANLLTIGLIAGLSILVIRSIVPHWWTEPISFEPELFLALLVTVFVLSAPGQVLISRFVDPYLYRGRLEHASALRQATRRLSQLMQPRELAEEVRRVLGETLVPETFAMAARPLEGGTLEDLSSDKAGLRDLLTVATLMSNERSSSVIVVNPGRESGALRAAHEGLKSAGVEIVATLVRRNQLLGAMLIGPRRSGDAYFASDLAFIESLAELTSIALENGLLYRQRIQMLEYSDRLLESLDSAVVAIDVSGEITSFNGAAAALLGLTENSRSLHLSILPSEVGWALAFAITGAAHPRELEVVIDHQQRGLLPVILSTAVLHDDQDTVSGALVVVTDLSTVKALERNQRRIEHFALMARFYAGIAHEIRSPLTAISNFISMLPDRYDDPEYRDTAARLLPIEVDRIVRLSDRLRLMAPSEDGKLSLVAVKPLLTDIVAIHGPAASENGVRATLNCPDDLPSILGDPSQLVQLFVNLLKNAIEAMPHGGTLTIRAFEHPVNRTIIVDVIDEGIGIDPSIRPNLFQPFFTTKPLGTGLGLPICREIADFHRARLTLSPRTDGRGTIARVEFAAASPDTSEHPTPQPSSPRAVLSGRRSRRT